MIDISAEIEIPENHWEWDDETECRGLTAIRINSCPMHLEAIAIITDEETGSQMACDAKYQQNLVDYSLACNSDGPMQRVEIKGQEYVLFATPFC